MPKTSLDKKIGLKLVIIASCILIPFLFSYAENKKKIDENGAVPVNKSNRQSLSSKSDMSKNVKQIQTLFWPVSNGFGGEKGLLKSCQERMRRLTAHGYIRRIRPFIRQGEARQPYIYSLDKRGADFLSGEMGIELPHIHWQPKNAEDNPSYLRHFLKTNDVQIALSLACKRNGVTLGEWLSDRELKSTGMKEYVTISGARGAKQRAAVVPDACFTLSWGNRAATFFLELDLGTVTIRPTLWERSCGP